MFGVLVIVHSGLDAVQVLVGDGEFWVEDLEQNALSFWREYPGWT